MDILINKIFELQNILKQDSENTFIQVVEILNYLIVFLNNMDENIIKNNKKILYINKLKKALRLFMYGIVYITYQEIDFIHLDLCTNTYIMKKRLQNKKNSEIQLGKLALLPIDIRILISQHL